MSTHPWSSSLDLYPFGYSWVKLFRFLLCRGAGTYDLVPASTAST